MPIKKSIDLADSPEKNAYNKYYMRIADTYRMGKWILLLLFTVYLTVMLLAYRDSMTRENLLFLMRNFNVSVGSDGMFASVVYDEQQNMTFDIFKGELVVAGSSEIAFYDGSGAVSLRDETAAQAPVLDAGDKYLLLYDEGGTSYSLYTPIARVARKTTDSAIQCATVGNSGVYAIATRSHEAKYLVTLYNTSFREIARYYRETYVTAMAIHPNGEFLAIVSIVPEESSLAGVLTLCKIGSDEMSDIPLGRQVPFAVSYLENGTLAVVTDESVLFFNENGQQKSTVSLSPMTLSSISISKTRVALVCSENILGTSNRILVLDSDGNVLTETTGEEKITKITASDSNIGAYIHGQDAVLSLTLAGETLPIASYSGNLLSVCEIAGRPIFCFPTGAQAVHPET